MYIPPAFREDRRDALHGFIRQHSFGTLVSTLDGELFATHLPFLLDAERGEHGTLLGHMARANPHWQGFAARGESLVLFRGPHAYVSPTWYVAEVAVPTWNYVAVHAYGRPRLVEDAGAVRALLEQTVRRHELPLAEPWSMGRLDAGYVAKMVEGVVAFEIPISRLLGKQKLSQNRSRADRRGVITALRHSGDPLGAEVATLMAAGLEPDADPTG